jgi:hypothetical protein
MRDLWTTRLLRARLDLGLQSLLADGWPLEDPMNELPHHLMAKPAPPQVFLRDVYDTPIKGEHARDPVGFLWALLGERRPEENISHTQMPSLREHIAFFDSLPYRHWYIIEAADGTWVGQANLTKRNEVGIQIMGVHRRKGFARQALKRLLGIHSPLAPNPADLPAMYVANINPENEASIALFQSLGATLLQVTYQLPGELR